MGILRFFVNFRIYLGFFNIFHDFFHSNLPLEYYISPSSECDGAILLDNKRLLCFVQIFLFTHKIRLTWFSIKIFFRVINKAENSQNKSILAARIFINLFFRNVNQFLSLSQVLVISYVRLFLQKHTAF